MGSTWALGSLWDSGFPGDSLKAVGLRTPSGELQAPPIPPHQLEVQPASSPPVLLAAGHPRCPLSLGSCDLCQQTVGSWVGGARSSHWTREHVVAPLLFGRDMVSTAGSEGCVCADVTEVRKWGSSPHCLSHLLGLRVVGVRMLLRNYKLHSEIFLTKTWFMS